MTDRIVVRTPNWVGDAVMSLPFLASLQRTQPDATIAALCRPGLAGFYSDVETIDRVIPLDESQGRSGFAAVRANARIIRHEDFTTAFSLPTSLGSALMFWLARIPRRVGHAAEGRGVLLTNTIPYGKNGARSHRAEGYLDLLSLAYPDATVDRELRYTPGGDAKAKTDRLWDEHRDALCGPLLAIAPGAAQPNKMWDTGRFADVARRWIGKYRGSVVCVGGPGDRARAQAVADGGESLHAINLAGAGDLPVAAEIIRRADAFIGNDSGLAHLAAAVGTRVVVISGPGDPSEVAPFSPHAVTVKQPLFCSPCYKNECWRKDAPLECLTTVTVDQAWARLETPVGGEYGASPR